MGVDRKVLRARARAMRGDPTPAERVMWRLLRSRSLEGLKFRRQVPMGRYIIDFVCLDPRVIVECDGDQHADSAYDVDRDAWFAAQGFRVFRFWNKHILEETESVLAVLLEHVAPR